MADKYVRRRDHSAHNGGEAVTYTEYVYDIGEHPVRQDMLERFRKMYPASNNEYQDHAFTANIQGKEQQIRIPTGIVRSNVATAFGVPSTQEPLRTLVKI